VNRAERIQEILQQMATLEAELAELKAAHRAEKQAFNAGRRSRKKKDVS
jgi:hypothetical protein